MLSVLDSLSHLVLPFYKIHLFMKIYSLLNGLFKIYFYIMLFATNMFCCSLALFL